jgi:hypothetical protein
MGIPLYVNFYMRSLIGVLNSLWILFKLLKLAFYCAHELGLLLALVNSG